MQPYHQQPRWGMPPGNRPRFGPGPPQHCGPRPMYGSNPQRPHGNPPMGQHRGPGPYRGHMHRPGGPPNGGHHRFPSDRHMQPQMAPQGSFPPRPMGLPPPRQGFEPFMQHQGKGFGPKHFGGGKPNGGPKKPKVDKRDLPENNRFYCDTCDRGYKDEDKYQAHVDTHEKCPEAGCTYVAAGKLVKLHVSLQHRSGMAKKIWSLESPEDIQKWREERRKHFPTAENIARKKEIIADKIARGEVIEEKYFGKIRAKHGNRFEKGGGRGRGRDRFKGNRNNSKPTGTLDQNQNQTDTESTSQKRKLSSEEASGDTETVAKQQKVTAKTGQEAEGDKDSGDPLAMFFGAGSSDSDSSDDGTEEATSTQISPKKAAGALGGLMASYEADGSDEDGTPDPDTKEKPRQSQHKQGGPENKQKNRQRTRPSKRGKDKWQPPPKLDKSLLERLLAKEIRQERNKILQCVHYIVKNNFFDVKSGGSAS